MTCLFARVDYVDALQRLVLEEVVFNPGPYQQLRDEVEVPEDLCAAYERPNMEEAVASRWSRYVEQQEEDEEEEELE